jgi:hypothetical protein
MGIFDGFISGLSGAINAVSSGVSRAINTVSSGVSSAVSSAGRAISSGASSFQRAVSSGVSSASRAASQAAEQAASAARAVSQAAATAASQAASAASSAASAAQNAARNAGNAVSGALSGITDGIGFVSGATYDSIANAAKSLEDARAQVAKLTEAGYGSMASGAMATIRNAESQLASARAAVQQQVTNAGAAILQNAKTAAAAIRPVDLAGAAALLSSPLGVSSVLGSSAAGTVRTLLASAEEAASPANTAVQSRLAPLAVMSLDYGNPEVTFVNPDGSPAGYLGEDAKPYAVEGNLLLFDTGNAYAPGKSSWTNTPDSGTLLAYGLGNNVAYTSSELYGADRANLIADYAAKGWLPNSGILSSLMATGSGRTSSVLNPGPTSSIQKAAPASNPISGIIQWAVGTRDDTVNAGFTNLMTGNTAVGAAQAGSAIAADVLLPLDLLSAANKAATGQDVTAEEWGYAALDAAFLIGGALSGGLVYAGGKALKTALKGGKAVSKGTKAAETAVKTAEDAASAAKNGAKAIDDASSTGSSVLKGTVKSAGLGILGGAGALGVASAIGGLGAALPEASDDTTTGGTTNGTTSGTTEDTTTETEGETFDLTQFTNDLIAALMENPDTPTTTTEPPGTENPDNTGILDGLGDAISSLIYRLGGGGTSITYTTGTPAASTATGTGESSLWPLAALAILGGAGVYAATRGT